jgi:hypothetical protein
MTNNDDWVCIEECRGYMEGEILRAKLEANGIPVQAIQESAGLTYGMTVGSLGIVQIFVPLEFAEDAKVLITPVEDDEAPA